MSTASMHALVKLRILEYLAEKAISHNLTHLRSAAARLCSCLLFVEAWCRHDMTL